MMNRRRLDALQRRMKAQDQRQSLSWLEFLQMGTGVIPKDARYDAALAAIHAANERTDARARATENDTSQIPNNEDKTA